MSIPKIYTDETAARRHLEKLQWPNGPECPHCGVVGNAKLLEGKSTRPGVYKCRECEKPFSVTVGTVFERSHIPLHKWLYAVHLLTASKKGHSSHQLHRVLGVTYKTAWFMSHRIREAFRPTNPPALGGTGKAVESDETYIGKQEGHTEGRGKDHKNIVLTLVERGGSPRIWRRVVEENLPAFERIITTKYEGSPLKEQRLEITETDIRTSGENFSRGSLRAAGIR
jgi:transposase-like protein